ncbi:DEAD/DEAH box helicase [Methanobrevibacter sp.]|uniref:DEAD/DEAH box helicase n=1 Tax=Methanobrevibacter sp. TaxID=66852 RepID=UPI002E76DD17|nr:DEAD/DEAH box helicase [Methanobrevibacter sp.]MEE1335682.1 DEAD/DEAH box helicase [Methanobrevibacter sp.]
MISNEEFEEIVVNVLERDISSNEDQKNAILSQPNQSLFLVAGPGSGKTTVMVLKILKFIFVDDIHPDEILATTFTKKAAEELYSRILGWGDEIKNHIIDESDDFEIFERIAKIDFNQIQVGTTDKLAEEIMRQHKEPGTNHPIIIENFVSNSAMIKILSENDRYKDENLQECLKRLTGLEKLDEPSKMSGILLEIKDRIFHDQIEMEKLYEEFESDKGMCVILDCIQEYENILIRRNTMDFAMLESRFLDLLKHDKLDLFLDNIRIVLIDEYQDTNLIQEDIYFTIAKSALKNNGNITVVGDDDQSLYRFRGATVDLFTNYKERVKDKLGIDVVEINLKTNYRSTENIINHCNQFVEIDDEYQLARVKNKPKIIAPDFDKDKMPVLGMFRNNVEMLSKSLANLISKLINEGEVKPKVLKVLDEDYFKQLNGKIDIAKFQQINEERERQGKHIDRLTLKLDSEYGSASDIAILSYSPKEKQFGNNSLLYYLRRNLKKQRKPIEVFNPRGIELQKVEVVEIFCGLMLECIDPEGKIQLSDKTIPNLAKVTMTRWRVRAREYIKLNPEPHEPINLSQFVLYWQNRMPRGTKYWPKKASLMELAYKLITWIEELQEDVEGIVYLEAITKSITQTGFFSKYYSNISFANKQAEKESILEAIWNIFIPLSTGGIQIDESLLETLPDDRVNILSIHQSKGLEFPLVIVDVGSKFRDNNIKTQKLRFPKKPPKNITIEDSIRQFSELGESQRSEKDRSFDDLTRLYFVAFSRAESVLLLVGLNSAIEGYPRKKDHFNIPNVALGWSRDEKYVGFNEIYLI